MGEVKIMRTIIILANTYRDARLYIREHNDEEIRKANQNDTFVSDTHYIYPERLESLRGLKDPEIIELYNWKQNENMIRAREVIKAQYNI